MFTHRNDGRILTDPVHVSIQASCCCYPNWNWVCSTHTRFCSIQLLGDLLYKISGVSGKMMTEMTSEEDENFGTEQSHEPSWKICTRRGATAYWPALHGSFRRCSARHTGSFAGRSSSPTRPEHCLRSCLPFSIYWDALASSVYDKRQVAPHFGRCCPQIVLEIIPVLEDGFNSNERDTQKVA